MVVQTCESKQTIHDLTGGPIHEMEFISGTAWVTENLRQRANGPGL